MKKRLLLMMCFFYSALLWSATIEPGDSSKRHKTDYVTNWSPEEEQTYTVGASANGCSFVDEKTKASDDATLKTHSSTGASAEKKITHTDVPNTSDFGFSVSGILAGSDSGSEVTWSATLQQKFFWLSPIEKISAAGIAVSVSANGDHKESTWSISASGNLPSGKWQVSNKDVKSESITLNKALWGAYNKEIPEGKYAPLIGHYVITGTSTETSNSDVANIYVVDITKPAFDGDPAKWEGGAGGTRYDCQAVTSSTPGAYTIPIWLGRAGRTDHSMTVSGGGSLIKSGNNYVFDYTSNTGEYTLQLRFDLTGDEVIASRKITVFRDHLERAYYNFGENRSCNDNWKPLARYGVKEADLPEIGQWNCHASVLHAYDNTNVQSSATTVSWPATSARANPDAAFWAGITLSRGDVVAFYGNDDQGVRTLAHSHTCLGSKSRMWGANNKGGWSNSWLWYTCSSEEYYNATEPRVNYVRIMPKP